MGTERQAATLHADGDNKIVGQQLLTCCYLSPGTLFNIE